MFLFTYWISTEMAPCELWYDVTVVCMYVRIYVCKDVCYFSDSVFDGVLVVQIEGAHCGATHSVRLAQPYRTTYALYMHCMYVCIVYVKFFNILYIRMYCIR
jgi:hypothetical protein